jgi:hypothetical protein
MAAHRPRLLQDSIDADHHAAGEVNRRFRSRAAA